VKVGCPPRPAAPTVAAEKNILQLGLPRRRDSAVVSAAPTLGLTSGSAAWRPTEVPGNRHSNLDEGHHHGLPKHHNGVNHCGLERLDSPTKKRHAHDGRATVNRRRVTAASVAAPPPSADGGNGASTTAAPPSTDGDYGTQAAGAPPSTNEANGRDENGRFAKGNTDGPGNPFARQNIGRLRREACARPSPGQM